MLCTRKRVHHGAPSRSNSNVASQPDVDNSYDICIESSGAAELGQNDDPESASDALVDQRDLLETIALETDGQL